MRQFPGQGSLCVVAAEGGKDSAEGTGPRKEGARGAQVCSLPRVEAQGQGRPVRASPGSDQGHSDGRAGGLGGAGQRSQGGKGRGTAALEGAPGSCCKGRG